MRISWDYRDMADLMGKIEVSSRIMGIQLGYKIGKYGDPISEGFQAIQK
jgi:hypothetical protein